MIAQLLLAKFVDVLPFLIVMAIMFASWAIQTFAKHAKAAQPPRKPPRVGKAAPRPAAANEPVRDEIEAFLRRAAQRRGGGAPMDIEILRPERSAPPPLPEAAPPVPAQLAHNDESSVTRHVRQHLGTSKFDERTKQLSSIGAEADARHETHRRETFSHALGSLGSTTAGYTTETQAQTPESPGQMAATHPAAAVGLAVMLGRSESLRDAVVLTEILRRPEERW